MMIHTALVGDACWNYDCLEERNFAARLSEIRQAFFCLQSGQNNNNDNGFNGRQKSKLQDQVLWKQKAYCRIATSHFSACYSLLTPTAKLHTKWLQEHSLLAPFIAFGCYLYRKSVLLTAITFSIAAGLSFQIKECSGIGGRCIVPTSVRILVPALCCWMKISGQKAAARLKSWQQHAAVPVQTPWDTPSFIPDSTPQALPLDHCVIIGGAPQ